MKYPIKRRMSPHVPWGYEIHPDNPKLLVPIEEHLDLLEEAIELKKKKRSYKELAAWMTVRSGRYISSEGLRKIYTKRRRKKRQEVRYKWWREFYDEEPADTA